MLDIQKCPINVRYIVIFKNILNANVVTSIGSWNRKRTLGNNW